jgi:NAD+-dependent protein deacetylase SIR2
LDADAIRREPDVAVKACEFVAKMRKDIAQARISRAHMFIATLYAMGRLLRVYTQNIDGLESRAGIPLVEAPHHKYMRGGHVRLHGTLMDLRCDVCSKTLHFSEVYIQKFLEGHKPECYLCEIGGKLHPQTDALGINDFKAPSSQGVRQLRARTGRLFPDIILYNQPHPSGEEIARIVHHDLGKRPDLLCIMGTSLSIPSLNGYILHFAREVKSNQGSVLFMNRTPPPGGEWHSVIDYHLSGDLEDWVERIRTSWIMKEPDSWQEVHLVENGAQFQLAELPVVEFPVISMT